MGKPRLYPNRRVRRRAALYLLAYSASVRLTAHKTGLKHHTVWRIRQHYIDRRRPIYSPFGRAYLRWPGGPRFDDPTT